MLLSVAAHTKGRVVVESWIDSRVAEYMALNTNLKYQFHNPPVTTCYTVILSAISVHSLPDVHST